MKYIDADKLIAEIERLKEKAQAERVLHPQTILSAKNYLLIKDYDTLLSIITSLQQEQPKFKVGDTIHEIGENTVFPMTIERISDGDYVCFTENTQSFINIEFQDDYELVEQEQPDLPSGEDIMTMCNQILIDWVKEGKTQEEVESREEAHSRFFELYDEYLMREQPEVELDKLVNEEFASRCRTTEYGLVATYNRAELYQFIKRMAIVFNARKEE